MREASPIHPATVGLLRSASDAIPAHAMPRSAGAYAWILANEWTHDARFEMPAADLDSFGVLSTRLYRLAVAAATACAEDDTQLDALCLPPRARDAIRRSRGEPNLLARLDFALVPAGQPDRYVPWLLEVNGDTSGNLVEAAVLQAEWGRATGHATAGDKVEECVERALRALPGLCVLHHPGDPYIAHHARWLVERVPGATRAEYPGPPDSAAATIMKVFRWGRLWEGHFPEVTAHLGARRTRVCEPAWCALLQHKGLLATMWDQAPGTPHLLPATLAGPDALPDRGAGGWAEKRFWGVAGDEVEVLDPGTPSRQPLPGVVVQARVPPLCLSGRYPILCAFLVDGTFAGAVVREDDAPVTSDDCVVPLVIH